MIPKESISSRLQQNEIGKLNKPTPDSYSGKSLFQQFESLNKKLDHFYQLTLNHQEMQQNNIVYQYCQKYEIWQIKFQLIKSIILKNFNCLVRLQKAKKNWNREDLLSLVWIVNKYAQVYQIQSVQDMKVSDWENIGCLIPGSHWRICMFRIIGLKQIKVSQFPWTYEEQCILLNLYEHFIQQFRKSQVINWKNISQEVYLRNSDTAKCFRSAKQCREHWACYLNPKITKGPWTLQQDIKLLQKIVNSGCQKRWSKLTKVLPQRTQNSIKNRYDLLLTKSSKLKCQKSSEHQAIYKYLQQIKKLSQKEQVTQNLVNKKTDTNQGNQISPYKNQDTVKSQESQASQCKQLPVDKQHSFAIYVPFQIVNSDQQIECPFLTFYMLWNANIQANSNQ